MGSMLKPTFLLLLLPFLLQALVAKTSAATEPVGVDVCTNVTVNLQACVDIIETGVLVGAPPAACCDGLKKIVDVEASLGVAKTCKCAQDFLAISIHDVQSAGTGVDISADLQATCGVNLGISLNVGATC